jgi:hypothetical protein
MSNCSDTTEDDEKNRKNAHILKAYVFRHEIWVIVKFAFSLFNHARHSTRFLEDTILLNHILINMLEEFSKGKILTVKTQKKTMRKKKKEQRRDSFDDDGAAYG